MRHNNSHKTLSMSLVGGNRVNFYSNHLKLSWACKFAVWFGNLFLIQTQSRIGATRPIDWGQFLKNLKTFLEKQKNFGGSFPKMSTNLQWIHLRQKTLYKMKKFPSFRTLLRKLWMLLTCGRTENLLADKNELFPCKEVTKQLLVETVTRRWKLESG